MRWIPFRYFDGEKNHVVTSVQDVTDESWKSAGLKAYFSNKKYLIELDNGYAFEAHMVQLYPVNAFTKKGTRYVQLFEHYSDYLDYNNDIRAKKKARFDQIRQAQRKEPVA